MKQFTKRGLALLLALVMSLSFSLTIAAEDYVDFNKEVNNITMSFGNDTKTSRNFAFTAKAKYNRMVVRYAPAGTDFETNYKETRARIIDSDFNAEGTAAVRHYYKVDITGLMPGTEYVYRIGDTDEKIWSKDYRFTTAGEIEDEFTFIAMTDPQGSEASSYTLLGETIQMAMKENPRFMITAGDLVDDSSNMTQWRWYMDAIRFATVQIPMMAVVGNHETVGELNAVSEFSKLFNHPSNGGKKAIPGLTADMVSMPVSKGVITNIEETIYSFDYGNVHCVVLNTGIDSYTDDCAIPLLEAQQKWLEEDLKNTTAKWKVIFMHQGMYPAKAERYFGMRRVLEDTVHKYGVDLVIQGHDHVNMRTYPMHPKKGIVTMENPDHVKKGSGTVYMIVGAAADKRYNDLAGIPNYVATITVTDKDKPTYTAIKLSEAKLDVITKDVSGTIIDKFEIYDESVPEKPAEPTPAPVAPAKKSFADVAESAWYHKAVTALAEGGLVNGLDETTFGPENTLTFAQFCQILAKAKGMETGEAGGYWAGKAIKGCLDAGYILSRGDISPANYDVAIPREAAVSAMYLAKKDSFTEAKKSLTLTDIPDNGEIAAEYKESILAAYNYGITSGVDESYTFLPKKSLSRAEVCQLFFNLNWTKAD